MQYLQVILKNGQVKDFHKNASYLSENERTFDIYDIKDIEKRKLYACIPIKNVLYIEWIDK